MSAHKRFCAHCRKPGGQLTANWWFPPLKLGQRRPVRVDPPCCFNPVGCGCLSGDCACYPGAGVFTPGCTQHLPSGAPTSVQLRHAEQEMDVVRGSLTELAALYESATAETARVLVERNQAIENGSSWKQQLDQAISMLAQIGDALSPTGERPEEALGTLVADVKAYVELHDAVEQERDDLRRRNAARFNETQVLKAELASATAELARYRTTPTSKEKTMPATADDGDPMINASTKAIWPHLPSEVQESCYEPDAITSWAAAGAAAALRVMADEIDRGPTFPLPPSIISALVRERANRLTDVPETGAR